MRLGRWLYYDTRRSADGSISCATCHRPENAFSEPTPVSTGINGQKGARKAFGSPEVTADRVAEAVADYERTRMSGNSPYDRWKSGDESAVSEEVKLGDRLFFFDKAGCNQCRLGYNFTDTLFHNLGVGWNPDTQEFSDVGRFALTNVESDRGAFKIPTVREVTKRAPYMHDGSVATLHEVVELNNRGGEANPYLDPKMKPLELTEEEIVALVVMMEALEGEGYMDTAPTSFPR